MRSRKPLLMQHVCRVRRILTAVAVLLAIGQLGLLPVLGQGKIARMPEDTALSSYPSGLSWQLGPGDNNNEGWTYPYGLKITLNEGIHRNWELTSIYKNAKGLAFRQFNQSTQDWTSWRRIITEDASGNVGLGTTDTGDHRLAVNGTAIATEVVVEEYGSWPDFVFAEDYEVPSLKEVNAYIKANGHLPQVPTAAEVAESGIALGSMQATLLQKIEELTLYAIEQQEHIAEQRAQNTALIQHLAQLEARLLALEQQ